MTQTSTWQCCCQCTSASVCVSKPVLSSVCQWVLAPARHVFRMDRSVPLSEEDLVQLQHPSDFFLFNSLWCVIFISVLLRYTFVLHAPISRSQPVLPFFSLVLCSLCFSTYMIFVLFCSTCMCVFVIVYILNNLLSLLSIFRCLSFSFLLQLLFFVI